MRLADALRAWSKRAIAFTGAGGKSSAMACLALELAAKRPIILSTTTHIRLDQFTFADEHWIVSERHPLRASASRLRRAQTLLITGQQEQGERKWKGLSESEANQLIHIANRHGACVLLEADGARGRSLKAPAEHEPVVPDDIELVVPVIGLDAVEGTLDERWVHRPERIVRVLGLDPGAPLRPEVVSAWLLHEEGGLKGIPPRAEIRVLMNKAENSVRIEYGRAVAEVLVASSRVKASVLSSVIHDPPVKEVHAPIAGVVLAAGGSRRFKRLKQLSLFRGKPLVYYAVQAALGAGLSPIVVVLGAESESVREALRDEPVTYVENPEWERGLSGSVRRGLQAVEQQSEGVVMLLADMPLVDAALIRALVQGHQESLSPLVAPFIEGRRGNPVLFDRETFASLHEIEGDQGGRVLFEEFPVKSIEWDESVLLDVDTADDLEKLRGIE